MSFRAMTLGIAHTATTMHFLHTQAITTLFSLSLHRLFRERLGKEPTSRPKAEYADAGGQNAASALL